MKRHKTTPTEAVFYCHHAAKCGFFMRGGNVEEEVFTRDEAAAFLKVYKGTVTDWIRSGRLMASRVDPGKSKSPYRICKSDCIAALKNTINNQTVNAVDMQEGKACQSNYVVTPGTATLSRQMDRELDDLLKHRTRGKRKNFTIV